MGDIRTSRSFRFDKIICQIIVTFQLGDTLSESIFLCCLCQVYACKSNSLGIYLIRVKLSFGEEV